MRGAEDCSSGKECGQSRRIGEGGTRGFGKREKAFERRDRERERSSRILPTGHNRPSSRNPHNIGSIRDGYPGSPPFFSSSVDRDGGKPHRLPPRGHPPSVHEINDEFMRIPSRLVPKITQDLMLPQDKDLTIDEKVYSCILCRLFVFSFPLDRCYQLLSRKISYPAPARTYRAPVAT